MLDITKILPRFEQMTIYNFIKDEEAEKVEGLGERQKMVYETLRDTYSKGATAKELSSLLHTQGKVMSSERNSVHPRLNELIKLGLVEVTGKKTCQYTDKRVSIYKVK